jgi:hypothetical protein
MDKIDSRTLPVDALNERRRRAVKMRLEGTSLKDTAAQCEMSRTTVIAAVKAYEAGGWKAVDVDRGGRPVGSDRHGGRRSPPEERRGGASLMQRQARASRGMRDGTVTDIAQARRPMLPVRAASGARR